MKFIAFLSIYHAINCDLLFIVTGLRLLHICLIGDTIKKQKHQLTE